jgi:glycosyltransferase involved in cell wall biosynthesis
MNILILTNTFTPHVGGVARSVAAFAAAYRARGHRVLVVAPEFPHIPQHEIDVVRIPAIQNFNASDFSVVLPVRPSLSDRIDQFAPEVVHSQHPFLLGMTAVRIARYRRLPLVFTHHTLYEQYTHYVPGDSPALKRFTIELATRYANLADQVFAPSESIQRLLKQRGVVTPITVVPTGVQLADFAHGDGAAFRARLGIPDSAYVIGHLSRLAPEKNLAFLARAVAEFAGAHTNAHFVVVGTGPSEAEMREIFAAAGIAARLHIVGILQRRELADALHAMDLFAFASRSETQGMVLTEAMAAGLPVVALDAPGVREVVVDRDNGRLLGDVSHEEFGAALQWAAALSPAASDALRGRAYETARAFSMDRLADTALTCYAALRPRGAGARDDGQSAWEDLLTAIRTEWGIWRSMAGAGDAAIGARLPSQRED